MLWTFAKSSVWLFLSTRLVGASDNGLALSPAMGWNSWNYFFCGISEDIIRDAAKQLVASGLNNYGYEYIIIDDCWQADSRDNKTGSPVAHPQKFPNGIKALADDIHGMGLKFGIYSSAGTKTCGGRFGSLGYEKIDADAYASWDVDYLKYDNCNNQGESGTPSVSYNRYNTMSQALNATGRPILYSMCNWGEDQPWNWAPNIANSWRISGDIEDAFAGEDDRCPCEDMLDCKLPGFHCSVAKIIDYASSLGQKAGSGGWNDLDMLEIGNGGMMENEYIAHFSMWAVLKSPLLLGNDLGAIDHKTVSIITNSAIIAINQDSADPLMRRWRRALPGDEASYSKAAGTPSLQLWSGRIYDNGGGMIAALLNTGESDAEVDVKFADIFKDEQGSIKGTFRVYDLWQREDSAMPSAVNDASEHTQRSLVSEVAAARVSQSDAWGKDIGVYKTNIPKVKIQTHSVKVWKLVAEDNAQTRDEL